MLAIHIELLAGRYVATAYDDRTRAEWPPHPARFFSALVATWGDDEPLGESGRNERAAMEWLEQQPPPEILADPIAGAGLRDVVPVFVPVNDVYQVAEVDRAKLEAAEAELATSSDGKQRAKMERAVAKLRANFATATAKAIAVPAKFGKDVGAGLELLPEHRGKQPRTFPCATPATARFAFVWPEAAPPREHLAALERLLSRLVRIGHSSSMVRADMISSERVAELRSELIVFRSDEHAGDLVIRWVEPGQVARLCSAYDQHRETEPRVLPARFVRYAQGEPRASSSVARGVFGHDFIAFARRRGPRLPITAVVGLARQFRRALMSTSDESIDPVLSGHDPDGAPTETPHLAIVPLPVVTGAHADGALVGVALVLPRDCDPEARRRIMRAIGRLEQAARLDEPEDPPLVELRLGAAGVVHLQRIAWMERSWALDARSWCRPSRRWATATPIALDRNPGDLHDERVDRREEAFGHAANTIAEAVGRIGLPEPTRIDVTRSCVLPGTAKPRAYPRYPIETSRTQRVLVHARLEFGEPIHGPVILGAGRYHGLGLCLPTDERRDPK